MKDIIKVAQYVKEKMRNESTGHDWYHVDRVCKIATKIAQKEKDVDMFIVQSASLLHDLGDWKVNKTGKSEEEIIKKACEELGIGENDKEVIVEIILNISFSKNIAAKKKLSKEGKIVQDADRLDALGAIGIARAFAYGGKNNRPLFNPEIQPHDFKSIHEYRTSENHTINHFYEKLFKIRKLLNTKAAKQMAINRERFMQTFLKQFLKEWDGKR